MNEKEEELLLLLRGWCVCVYHRIPVEPVPVPLCLWLGVTEEQQRRIGLVFGDKKSCELLLQPLQLRLLLSYACKERELNQVQKPPLPHLSPLPPPPSPLLPFSFSTKNQNKTVTFSSPSRSAPCRAY